MSVDDENDRGGENDRGAPGGGGIGGGGPGRGSNAGVGLGVFSGLLGKLLDLNSQSSHGAPMSPGHRPTPGFRRRRRQSRDAPSSPERPDTDDRDESDDYLFDTRLEDDEFVVAADIPDATEDDIAVGIRRRTNDLLIRRDDAVLGCIDIPWASPEATRVWLNNGVLVVRLQPRET